MDEFQKMKWAGIGFAAGLTTASFLIGYALINSIENGYSIKKNSSDEYHLEKTPKYRG